MKALFAHGLRFLEDAQGTLYLRGYNKEYWTRYLNHFNELYVIGRNSKAQEGQIKQYDIFSGEGLRFIEVPEIFSPLNGFINYYRSNKIIENLVLHSDYVIARLPGIYASIAIKYSKKHNKPYLIELVGCPWDSLWNHSFKGKILAPLSKINTKRDVKNAPYVIYVTREFFQTRYPTDGKSTNCTNVSLPYLDDAILHRRIQKIQGMGDKQKLIIGTAAAVDVRYKGQQYVIEALGELKRLGITNFEYHLAGGGKQNYLNIIAYKNGVANQVVFLGSLTHNRIFDWLDEIDIYVQPSKVEGLPRALIEAMSRGLPAFGSRAGGIPELLEPTYMFNKNNYKKEIGYILRNMTKEVMLEQAKRNFAEASNYELSVLAEKRQRFIQAFVDSGNNNPC